MTQPVEVGQGLQSLTVHLTRGEPARVVIPTHADLVAPIVEWSRDGQTWDGVAHTLTRVGSDAESRNLWAVTLTAEQVEALHDGQKVRAARVAETTPRLLLWAGDVVWGSGWAGVKVAGGTLVAVGVPVGAAASFVEDPPGSGLYAQEG
ncbi:hypothetical protein [Citricoccus sp.]|uniref:hypothetical protein n=1 Tax=Citricoccus sp. TaxID=1978372 RepID=UPI002CF41CF0|nr:hypothetical protein [Citricoccus sp.]HRO95085.1 hypothetical protein [Citricoccus sp.]